MSNCMLYIFFLSICCINVYGQIEVTHSSTGYIHVLYNSNDTIELTCNGNDPNTKWTIGGKLLSHGSIELRPASAKDEGTYECRAPGREKPFKARLTMTGVHLIDLREWWVQVIVGAGVVIVLASFIAAVVAVARPSKSRSTQKSREPLYESLPERTANPRHSLHRTTHAQFFVPEVLNLDDYAPPECSYAVPEDCKAVVDSGSQPGSRNVSPNDLTESRTHALQPETGRERNASVLDDQVGLYDVPTSKPRNKRRSLLLSRPRPTPKPRGTKPKKLVGQAAAAAATTATAATLPQGETGPETTRSKTLQYRSSPSLIEEDSCRVYDRPVHQNMGLSLPDLTTSVYLNLPGPIQPTDLTNPHAKEYQVKGTKGSKNVLNKYAKSENKSKQCIIL